MEPYEREALLERVERESATVGASIPERLRIEGETVALRDRILALQRMDTLDEPAREERDRLLVALRGKRQTLRDQLEHDPIDRQAGEEIAERIIDIDRARAALRQVGEDTDIADKIRQQRVEDVERWRAFVKRTRGDLERSLAR